MTEDFTLGMALFDYTPIIFSAIALTFICRLIREQNPDSFRPAVFGASLVIVAALCKASWKLVWAIAAVEVDILQQLLFPLMAPGFLILTVALYQAFSPGRATNTWALPLCLAGLLMATWYGMILFHSHPRAPFFTLLLGLTLANSLLCIRLIIYSWKSGLRLAALLVLINLLGIFGMSYLGRIAEQTAALQWIEESLNATIQAALAWGAWLIYKHR